MIVALDLETTWLDSWKDTIIEIALIKIHTETFEVLDVYNTFVDPQRDIPEIISEITNITQLDVEGAPIFSEIASTVQEFIGDSPILGHNTNFDRDFLLSHGIDIQKNLVLDTFFLANFLLLELKSLNLGFISQHLGITIESEHRAIDDTKGTVEVYKKLIKRLQWLSPTQKKIYRYITDISQDKQGIFFRENYLSSEKKIPAEKLIEEIMSTISSKKGSHRVEQYYEEKPLDIDTVFSSFDDFESRENQNKMAHMVYDSLTQSKKSVVEAPTGIGKTFAYLIPSILFSTQFGEQVFISTSTKTLQDQIFLKDLEFLSQNMQRKFSFTKLKWKKNYISLCAFFTLLSDENHIETWKTSFLMKIAFWLLITEAWELDELDYYGEEFSFLHDINATLSFTSHTDNPYLENEFMVQARDRAKKSNIVIINNHILFQDISSEWRILGKVKNLILDESHSLEDVVTQSLKKGFSIVGISKVWDSLLKTLKKQWSSLSEPVYIQEKMIFEVSSLMDLFSEYVLKKVSADARYKNILIKPEFFSQFPEAFVAYEKIISHIEELRDFTESLPEADQLLVWREISYFTEVQDILEHIFSNSGLFSTIIPVVSIKDNFGVILEYTLLNPGKFLKTHLWSQLDTAVLTSATLQIEESYWYIQEMLSLEDFDFYTLETDFNYEKQSLLFIPTDLGSIKYNIENILDFLRVFLPKVGWRTLILVTAFSMIQQCFVSLNKDLKSQGIHLLAQSVSGGKQKQIDFFKKHSDTSVLMGTDTFWEWVDIKGDDLRYLIIHKIPFMVPSDPIFQARSSLFQDSFAEYSIPKSILKLKQWFGRLIRTKTDSWVVVFLDDRIFSTSWGERFFSAFPKGINIKKSPSQRLISIVKK